MIRGCILLALAIAAAGENSLPRPKLIVAFPFERIPHQIWARELVWLKTAGVPAITSEHVSGEARTLAQQAGLQLTAPEGHQVSLFNKNPLVESRREMVAGRPVVWSNLESESAPEYRRGAVSFGGEEDDSTQALKREALLLSYWGTVLAGEKLNVTNRVPDTLAVEQKAIRGASALSVINGGRSSWSGEIHVALPSYGHSISVPNVNVPAGDALLLPVDVAFADPRFCRFCSGMSNSERLLYATAELTGMEYENGILSFEFYAPVAGVAVLQLERQPSGPMLAAGHPIQFDWDPEAKRARLPIPAGRNESKRVRVAVTMTGPDEVASFVDVHRLVIGEVNRFVTDYSSEALRLKSRLIAPAGWNVKSEVKSPTEVAYQVEVPGSRLHGDHEDLRLEANGVGMSHVRVQLLRPVSVHVREANAVHFGSDAELISEPPVVSVEGANGRDFTLQLRNNAPEIRTFHLKLHSDDGLEFSPAETDVSIGPSMEREISTRVFANHGSTGIHLASLDVLGATGTKSSLRFVVFPRGQSVHYEATLTGTGTEAMVWENARIRVTFSREPKPRWLEFYWKESGKSLLPPQGVPLTSLENIVLKGSEILVPGMPDVLPPGGQLGNVHWTAIREGSATRYQVWETTVREPTPKR